jgi:Rod binding domain-containing protein
MSSPVDTSTAKSYMDFSGLGELRGKAVQNQDKALKETAQQFEGMFIQMMMKSMREANNGFKDEENESSARETFEGMFDKEVSLQMAKRGAMGVADFMERAVKAKMPKQPSTADMLKAREQQGMVLNPPAQAMSLVPVPKKAFELEKPTLKPLNGSMKLLGGKP